MIKVPRKSPGPGILTAAQSVGEKETKLAIEFFQPKPDPLPGAPPAKRPKSFTFAAYKSEEVKAALEEMFQGKCAYCESKYAATAPMDVEHWRPKGAVQEEDGTLSDKGYYWLAANWENLLPSCIDCNRARNHLIVQTGDAAQTLKRVVGKANRFPLEPGSARATTPGSQDTPLLLNPCIDEPAEHIFFDDMAVVLPANKSKRAEASIDVYGLNRLGLVLERRQVLKLIQHRTANIRMLMRLLDGVLDNANLSWPREIIDELLRHEINDLLEFKLSHRAYSQLARQHIDVFLKEEGLEALLESA